MGTAGAITGRDGSDTSQYHRPAMRVLEWPVWDRLDELDRRAGLTRGSRRGKRSSGAFIAAMFLLLALLRFLEREWVLGVLQLALAIPLVVIAFRD
jgi:hypothetical protein